MESKPDTSASASLQTHDGHESPKDDLEWAPVVKGCNASAAAMVAFVAMGYTVEQVAYDRCVTVETVRTALRHASALLSRYRPGMFLVDGSARPPSTSKSG